MFGTAAVVTDESILFKAHPAGHHRPNAAPLAQDAITIGGAACGAGLLRQIHARHHVFTEGLRYSDATPVYSLNITAMNKSWWRKRDGKGGYIPYVPEDVLFARAHYRAHHKSAPAAARVLPHQTLVVVDVNETDDGGVATLDLTVGHLEGKPHQPRPTREIGDLDGLGRMGIAHDHRDQHGFARQILVSEIGRVDRSSRGSHRGSLGGGWNLRRDRWGRWRGHRSIIGLRRFVYASCNETLDLTLKPHTPSFSFVPGRGDDGRAQRRWARRQAPRNRRLARR